MSTMIIKSRPYGEIEIPQDEIITFPFGILAFEDYKEYVILSDNNNAPLFWLQNIEDHGLAFVIIKPELIFPEYSPDISTNQLSLLFGSTNLNELSTWCIVTIPQDQPEKMTMNLQGPLILSLKKRIGGQFISGNENHPVRRPILDLIKAGEIA